MTRKRGKRSKGGAKNQEEGQDIPKDIDVDNGNTKSKVIEKTVAEVLSDLKANSHLYKDEAIKTNQSADSFHSPPYGSHDDKDDAKSVSNHHYDDRHHASKQEKYDRMENDFPPEQNGNHRHFGNRMPHNHEFDDRNEFRNERHRDDFHGFGQNDRPRRNDRRPHHRNERHSRNHDDRRFEEHQPATFTNVRQRDRFENRDRNRNAFGPEGDRNPDRHRPPPFKQGLLPLPSQTPSNSVPSLFDIDPFEKKPEPPNRMLEPPGFDRPHHPGPDRMPHRSMSDNENVMPHGDYLIRNDPPFPPMNQPPPNLPPTNIPPPNLPPTNIPPPNLPPTNIPPPNLPPTNIPPPGVDPYGSAPPPMTDTPNNLPDNFQAELDRKIAAVRNDPLYDEAEKETAIQDILNRRSDMPGNMLNTQPPPPVGPPQGGPPAVASLFSREEEDELRRSLQSQEHNNEHSEEFHEPPNNYSQQPTPFNRPHDGPYNRPHHNDSFQRQSSTGDRGRGGRFGQHGGDTRRERVSKERKERNGRRTYLSNQINKLFSQGGYVSDEYAESSHSRSSRNTGMDDFPINNDEERKKSQELYEKHIALTEEEIQQIDNPVVDAQGEEQKEIPAFMKCPLCQDLLEDPVVLPCFHTICRDKCLSRLIKDNNNLWCPQCSDLVNVKQGMESLKPAVTFEKMIAQHKEEREKDKEQKEQECEGDLDKIAEVQKQFEKQDKAEDITCFVCNKIFSLPVMLQCGHSICKFPCAYKTVQFNSKILCGRCEKPCWVNSISELSIDKEAIYKVQKIKGEQYLEHHAREVRSLEDEDRADRTVGIVALFDDDDTFKWRISLLDNVKKQKEEIPSLLNMPLGAPLPIVKPKDNRPKRPKRKKNNSLDDDEFNPDDLFPSEDPPQMEQPQEMYYQPEPAPAPLPKNTPADFMANLVRGQVPIYTPNQPPPSVQIPTSFTVPPPTSSAAGVMPVEQTSYVQETPAAAPAPLQPPVLDVKSMVPENPGPDFDYIAPWNLFAQQTQNYYATYYASAGGIPPEAQTQVKEYLEKCWSWYSAYFKMQQAKHEKPDQSAPTVEPASQMEAAEIATQVKKLKSVKQKKEKEKLLSEISSEVAASVTSDEKAEAKEIEELKILLLKKQLEQKMKTAKSKSEARDLKKLKEMVEKEEGDEELDPETKAQKEKEEKEAREKEMEQLREAARQKQLEREKQIEELEKKRKRTRKEELRKLEKARRKTKEKKEREERDRDDKDKRKQREGSRDDYEDERNEPDYRNKGNDYYNNKGYNDRGGHHENYRGGFRGRGNYRGGPGGERGGFIPRGRGRGRGRGGAPQQWHGQQQGAPWEQRQEMHHDSYDPYSESRPQPPYTKKRKISRSLSKSRSRSRSKSRDSFRSSRSGSADSYRRRPRQSPPPPLMRKKVQPAMKLPDPVAVDEKTANEPKFVKVTNLPDDVTAKSLKSFVEAFGRVEKCKIGKMQGEMMAVCQMQTMTDAVNCVREMHGLPFKGKILDVKYMGDKPMVKQVEVSIPDVYDRPSKKKPKSSAPTLSAASSTSSFGGDPSQRPEQRKLIVANLPWGTRETEVIDIVSHHAFVLSCRVEQDRYTRQLYAEVGLESYFDVLKCVNAMHGTHYEGRQLEVKKMTM